MNLWSASQSPSCIVAGPDAILCSPSEAADLGYWEDLAALGIYELLSDTDDAPLGYSAPVLETRAIDGVERLVAAQYALGSEQEREVEMLRLWRESFSVDAWQARYILAGTPALESGPLATFVRETLLAQIDAFVGVSLPAPALEKFRGAKTWRRNDPMLIQLVGIAGLDDGAIDDWFRAAAQVE
jgi:hypothetical protein